MRLPIILVWVGNLLCSIGCKTQTSSVNTEFAKYILNNYNKAISLGYYVTIAFIADCYAYGMKQNTICYRPCIRMGREEMHT